MTLPRTRLRPLVAAACLLATASAQGPLVGVSIAPGSQDGYCAPVAYGVYAVTAPPFPFDVGLGIGLIVDPAPAVIQAWYAMHDHAYVAPHVPEPTHATVDYEFRWPVAVTSLEIVQHENGISKVETFVGGSFASMTSLGETFGPSGDVEALAAFAEFETQVFQLPAAACGTHFRVVIRKTTHVDGWANYRIYPRDASGTRIPSASAPNALTLIASSTSSSAGIVVALQLDAGAGYAGFPYLIAGSVSGSCPGMALSGLGTGAVNYDFYTAYTMSGSYVPEAYGFIGVLDAFGSGTANIAVPPGLYPVLIGTTFTHAGGAINMTDVLFCNPVTFTVTP